MNDKRGFRMAASMRPMCLVIVLALLTTVPAFAAVPIVGELPGRVTTAPGVAETTTPVTTAPGIAETTTPVTTAPGIVETTTPVVTQEAVIVPKMAFAVNSNQLFLFDNMGKLMAETGKTALPVITVLGSTYVPIRDFCNAMGYGVGYNQQTGAVSIDYMGSSSVLTPISTLADLAKGNVYFSLNGSSYAQVHQLACPKNFSVVKKDHVVLFYSTVSPAAVDSTVSPAAVESTVSPAAVDSTVSPAAVESTVSSAAVESTVSPAAVESIVSPAAVESTVSPAAVESIVSPEAIDSTVFTVQDQKPVLTDSFIQMVQKTAIDPHVDYTIILYNAYDVVYYRPFVNPYVPYSYLQMEADIAQLKEQYPEYIRSISAGKSVEGRELTTIEFGNGNKHIYVFGSHHAREYMSTSYIMKFVNETAYAAKTGINRTNYDVQAMLSKVTFHIIPMVNPDGVNLVQNGIDSVSPAYREKVRAMKLNDPYGYRSWKSNINGVDLNRNYPTKWRALGTGRASSMYPGPYAASEPEVQAVMNYMGYYPPEVVVAVHTQGQLLYWSNPEQKMGGMIGKILKSSGYRPIQEDWTSSKAGYLSNYISATYKKCEMTVELCKYIGPYPYPDAQFDRVWAPSKDILLIVGDEVAKQS